jgi:NAD(P)-dependent dehydrogenase (short-subunit alcohol dehydrogenase family)
MSESGRSEKVCVVAGVGEGPGAALALPFAAGYKIALIARSPELDVRPFKEKF